MAAACVMAEPLSKRFIQELEPARDRLYVSALTRVETPRGAEAMLQRLVRQAFASFAEGTLAGAVPAALEAELDKAGVVATAGPDAVMPADVWARLTAAVQIAAARMGAAGGAAGSGKGINPESVLLLADPLLAPKKNTTVEDPFEALNLSPPSRFMLASGIAIVLGLGLSIYIMSRRSNAHPVTTTSAPAMSAPSTSRAASTPATAPTTAPTFAPAAKPAP